MTEQGRDQEDLDQLINGASQADEDEPSDDEMDGQDLIDEDDQGSDIDEMDDEDQSEDKLKRCDSKPQMIVKRSKSIMSPQKIGTHQGSSGDEIKLTVSRKPSIQEQQRASRTRLATSKVSAGQSSSAQRKKSQSSVHGAAASGGDKASSSNAAQDQKRLRSGAQIKNDAPAAKGQSSTNINTQQAPVNPQPQSTQPHKVSRPIKPQQGQVHGGIMELSAFQEHLQSFGGEKQIHKFLYKPFTPLPDLSQYLNSYIEIRVHKCYVTRNNKAYRERLFYGQDQYTSDSDLVCMMQHFSQNGFVVPMDEEEGNFEAYAVLCKVLKNKPAFQAFFRNGIKSRKITGFEGHNLKVEQVFKIRQIGSDEELLQMASKMPSNPTVRNHRKAGKQKLQAQLQLAKLSDPIYKALNEAFVFNLSLETSSMYNLCHFVDQAINDQLTSSRLRNQVLYLETNSTRYELARFVDESPGSSYKQIYRLAVVRDPHLKDNSFFAGIQKLPLPEEHLETIVCRDLEWQELVWGTETLKIENRDGVQMTINPLRNYVFRPMRQDYT